MATKHRSLASRQVAHAKCMETWRERSERVAVNLPPDLLPLWERIQDGIKGLDGDDRATKFMEYVEARPSEALAAVEQLADAKLAALLRERAADDDRIYDIECSSDEAPF